MRDYQRNPVATPHSKQASRKKCGWDTIRFWHHEDMPKQVTDSRAAISGDQDLTVLDESPVPVLTPARAVATLLGDRLSG